MDGEIPSKPSNTRFVERIPVSLRDHQTVFKGAKGKPRIVSVVARDGDREFFPGDDSTASPAAGTVQIPVQVQPIPPVAPAPLAVTSPAPSIPSPPAVSDPAPAPVPYPIDPLVSNDPQPLQKRARTPVQGKGVTRPPEEIDLDEPPPGELVEEVKFKRKGNPEALAKANAARKANREQASKPRPLQTARRRG